MQLIPNHIDELIARNLAGNASEEEQNSLREWILASKENTRYYEELKFIFETSEQEKKSFKVDTNAAWNKIKSNFEEDSAPVYSINQNKKQRFSFFSIAAGLALVCLIAVTVYYFIPAGENRNELLSVVTDEKSVEQKLPDGSIVTVNPNSSFVSLHKTKREYKLSGNAFFDVKHDEKNPFIIHVNNLCIKDIGTSFSVEADPREDAIRVIVTEGSVQLYTMRQEGMLIQKGEIGTYYKSSDMFEKISDDTDLSSKTFSMNFENARLIEVTSILEEQFNTKIIFDNEKLQDCRISVKFNASKLKEILEVIGETLDIWTSEKDGIITLGGEGCDE